MAGGMAMRNKLYNRHSPDSRRPSAILRLGEARRNEI
jgi:hypothetical protein